MSEVQIDRVHQASTTALGGNIRYSGLEWQPEFRAEYRIYIYNVSRRTFSKVGPHANVNIPGVVDGDPVLDGFLGNEMYHYVTSFPQPMTFPKFDDQSSEIGTIKVDARRYVMDIINPDNMTFSLETVVPPESRFSINNDLSIKGVFFSLSNPPMKAETRSAIKRMEDYYHALLQKAQTLELTDKVKLAAELEGNPDFAYAADYYNKATSWNRKEVRPTACMNCGEMKPFGVKFHVNQQVGIICVEPTKEAWKAAYDSGAKTKEQVPEDYIWWPRKEKKEKESE
jgi:hypothetical protein